MAVVPYNPVPTVAPTTVATPQIREDVPGAAFGTNIAEAIKGLGGAESGVGTEIFARAVAFQQINNEAESRDAATNFMIDAGKEHARFNALPPGQREAAFDGYMQNLQNLRQQYRDKLSNPMSQRMFDADSMSTMGRTIFNGAGVMATGARDFSNLTLENRMESNIKSMGDNSGDDNYFETKRQENEKLAGEYAIGKYGAKEGDSVYQYQVKLADSKAIARRATGMAEQHRADEGLKFLEANKGKMFEDDYNHAYKTVNMRAESSLVAKSAYDVYNEFSVHVPGKPDHTLGEMQDEVRKRVREAVGPNQPEVEMAAVRAVKNQWIQSEYAKRQEGDQLEQALVSKITNPAQGTLAPTNLEQYLQQNPGMQDFLDKLRRDHPEKAADFPAKIHRWGESLNRPVNEARAIELRGMLESPEGRDEFMQLDPTKEDHQTGIWMMRQREKIIGGGQGSLGIGKYFSEMQRTDGAALDAMHVYDRHTNKQKFYAFQGEIAGAVQEWLGAKGSMPTMQDFREKIKPELLKQYQTRTWYGGAATTYQAQTPTPLDDKHKIADWYRDHGQPAPTEQQINLIYHRLLYRKAFKEQKEQNSAPTAAPTVPQSR